MKDSCIGCKRRTTNNYYYILLDTLVLIHSFESHFAATMACVNVKV